MITYHQNGIISEIEYILGQNDPFAIQHDTCSGRDIFFYPGDALIRKLDSELVNLADKFTGLYFPDLELYYKEVSNLPVGLLCGGQNSNIPIAKNEFLRLSEEFSPYFDSIYRHLYVGDCQYLVYTIQNLLMSAEHCYLQYYIKIAQVDCKYSDLGEVLTVSNDESMQLLFYLETFFIKLYSILDMIVKIIFELENPTETFDGIKKMKCSEKLWGDKKRLRINNCSGTVFEDCETVRIIESLRNEAVHNGTWEFRPRVFLEFNKQQIVKRYMLFPDFDEGRLSSVKNRKHFFSAETKVNDILVAIHDDFYTRLLATLRHISKM